MEQTKELLEKITEDLELAFEQISNLKQRIAKLEGNHTAIYGK